MKNKNKTNEEKKRKTRTKKYNEYLRIASKNTGTND